MIKRVASWLVFVTILLCAFSTTVAEKPKGGEEYKGDILFVEKFQNTSFGRRGWYDVGSNVTLTTDNPSPGSTQVFECEMLPGSTVCTNGVPTRARFKDTEAVYLSYWVRYSPNYIGSNRSYHPHEFMLLSNKDGIRSAPANSVLAVYIEQNAGIPRFAIQDSQNVDNDCILRNDDTFQGCNGDFNTYQFTENRSVSSCNGLVGDYDIRDCYLNGSYWYSSRTLVADKQAYSNTPGPNYKADWHFVEVFIRLNDIEDGIGIPNGNVRYWVDGELYISSDNILFRTGKYPDLAFNILFFSPYIGDGSPIKQMMWVGEITVAKGVMPE